MINKTLQNIIKQGWKQTKMDLRNTSIEPDYFYHIYNRGVNGETGHV